METCNPLQEETEEGDGEEEEGKGGVRVEEEWIGGMEMVGVMWVGGLEKRDFASLQQFITGLPQAKGRCWGGVGWSRIKYVFISLKESFLSPQKVHNTMQLMKSVI